MGNIFLTLIDKGHFFRKPFSWLYVFLAVVSLLAPIYMIYNAFLLNYAYYDREKYREKFEIVSQRFESIAREYEFAVKNNNQLESELQHAHKNYIQADEKVNYYVHFTEGYKQEYASALQLSERFLAIYNEIEIKYEEAQQEVKKLIPEYNKINLEKKQASDAYNKEIIEYNTIAPKGAFHADGLKDLGTVALVLFSILSIFIGVINFQIFMDRQSKMNLTSKENDEFIAIPVVAHTIQTIGEAIGIYIGIMGTFTILIAIVFKACFGYYGLGNLYIIDLENLSKNLLAGIPYTLLPIIVGYTTIVIFRILAEGIKAIVVIANNTKK